MRKNNNKKTRARFWTESPLKKIYRWQISTGKVSKSLCIGEMQIKATMIHHCTHIRITRKWLPELGLEGRVNDKVSAWKDLVFNGTVLFLDCGAGYIIVYLSKLNCTIKREFYVNLEYLKKHRGREGSFFAQMHVVSESRASICHHGELE